MLTEKEQTLKDVIIGMNVLEEVNKEQYTVFLNGKVIAADKLGTIITRPKDLVMVLPAIQGG